MGKQHLKEIGTENISVVILSRGPSGNDQYFGGTRRTA